MNPKRYILSLPELPGLVWRQRTGEEIIQAGDYLQTPAGWYYLVLLESFHVGRKVSEPAPSGTPCWTMAEASPEVRKQFIMGLEAELIRRQRIT